MCWACCLTLKPQDSCRPQLPRIAEYCFCGKFVNAKGRRGGCCAGASRMPGQRLKTERQLRGCLSPGLWTAAGRPLGRVPRTFRFLLMGREVLAQPEP